VGVGAAVGVGGGVGAGVAVGVAVGLGDGDAADPQPSVTMDTASTALRITMRVR
jgi:3-oxoacid CoA-transferase subunit B